MQIILNMTLNTINIFFSLGMQGWFNIHNSNKNNTSYNRFKDKNHMIISMHAENVFIGIQHLFMIKAIIN